MLYRDDSCERTSLMKYCHYLLAFFVLTLPQTLLSSYYYYGEANPASKRNPSERTINRALKKERRRKFPKTKKVQKKKSRATHPCTGDNGFHRSSRAPQSRKSLKANKRSQTNSSKTKPTLGPIETLASELQIFDAEIIPVYIKMQNNLNFADFVSDNILANKPDSLIYGIIRDLKNNLSRKKLSQKILRQRLHTAKRAVYLCSDYLKTFQCLPEPKVPFLAEKEFARLLEGFATKEAKLSAFLVELKQLAKKLSKKVANKQQKIRSFELEKSRIRRNHKKAAYDKRSFKESQSFFFTRQAPSAEEVEDETIEIKVDPKLQRVLDENDANYFRVVNELDWLLIQHQKNLEEEHADNIEALARQEEETNEFCREKGEEIFLMDAREETWSYEDWVEEKEAKYLAGKAKKEQKSASRAARAIRLEDAQYFSNKAKSKRL